MSELYDEKERDQLLREIHHALIGDPLQPDKPGIVAIVARHDRSLYGITGKNGLVGDNMKWKRLFWVGTGIFFALQAVWAYILAVRTSGVTPGQ
jgi:hypothetical protein